MKHLTHSETKVKADALYDKIKNLELYMYVNKTGATYRNGTYTDYFIDLKEYTEEYISLTQPTEKHNSTNGHQLI